VSPDALLIVAWLAGMATAYGSVAVYFWARYRR